MSDSTPSTTTAVITPTELPVENHARNNSHSRRSPSMRLSLLGLILAVIGLGLAVVPSLATERALPNPFESKDDARRRNADPPPKVGGITLRVKSFSINFFGKDAKEPAPVPQPVAVTNDPVRWLMISGCVLALISLVVSSIAQLREQHGFMTFAAMSCSVVALTWQFFVIGIMLGIAAVVFCVLIAVLFR